MNFELFWMPTAMGLPLPLHRCIVIFNTLDGYYASLGNRTTIAFFVDEGSLPYDKYIEWHDINGNYNESKTYIKKGWYSCHPMSGPIHTDSMNLVLPCHRLNGVVAWTPFDIDIPERFNCS